MTNGTQILVVAGAEADPTQLAQARPDRHELRLYNEGAATIYLGSSGVTAAAGLPLEAGKLITLSDGGQGAIYAVVDGETDTLVGVCEVF